MFCAVFSYEVDDREPFERVYGPDGSWAWFFRRADGYLGTEHVLLGMLRNDDGTAVRILARMGVSPEALEDRLFELRGRAAS